MTGKLEALRQFGSPIEVVGNLARAAICAPPGSRLLVGDFSGIESRVLAWTSGQQSKLDQWARFDRTGDANDDPYVVIGRSFGHPDDKARGFGKNRRSRFRLSRRCWGMEEFRARRRCFGRGDDQVISG